MPKKRDRQPTIVVIGGGPAGMMAAGQAVLALREQNSTGRVILLEKMSQPGRKLSITGKGRCNLTNLAPLRDFITRFGKNGKFLRQAFNQFFAQDLADFFGELGVEIKTERGGRVFPADDNAPALTEALITWAHQSGVTITRDTSAERLRIKDNTVVGVVANGKKISCEAVILCTGGKSYPATGSTGDGYLMARAAGHTIVPVRPSLVPLETKGPVAKRLQGLSLKNVQATVFADNKKLADAFGEMLFTHFGLSGPIILTLSRTIVDALADKKQVTVSLDLKPALDAQKLDARLLRDLQANSRKQFHSLLKGLLPGKLIDLCPELVGIPADKVCNQISASERKRLLTWLKDFRFEITRARSFKEAIVTAGGVDLREIDPRTMASKLVSGLYIAGELLDLDGETGGFNLQAAFSTGFVAGISAAEQIG